MTMNRDSDETEYGGSPEDKAAIEFFESVCDPLSDPHIVAWVAPEPREGSRSIFFRCDYCRTWHIHGQPVVDYGERETHRVSHCQKCSGYFLVLNYNPPPAILSAFRNGRRPKKS